MVPEQVQQPWQLGPDNYQQGIDKSNLECIMRDRHQVQRGNAW